MISLKLYKNGEFVKECKVAFIPWSLTRFCASLLDAKGQIKDNVYKEDPMKLYEDLIIKLFANQVDEKVFEEYEIEGTEVVKVGQLIFGSINNKDEKN